MVCRVSANRSDKAVLPTPAMPVSSRSRQEPLSFVRSSWVRASLPTQKASYAKNCAVVDSLADDGVGDAADRRMARLMIGVR